MERVFLIGYMGSGKSKTAESLAKQLGFSVVDLDRIIKSKW
ncbi:MAG: AAA family ATPase [Bacteroidetes bacterium]|nr:AAA family ATPase [Bacteroidota bacterium]